MISDGLCIVEIICTPTVNSKMKNKCLKTNNVLLFTAYRYGCNIFAIYYYYVRNY